MRLPTRALLFWAVLAVSLTLTLGIQFLPGQFQLREGDVARQTIKSPRRVQFVSQFLTNQAREEAAARVADIYAYDPALAGQQVQRLRNLGDQITAIRQSTNLTDDEKRTQLSRLSEAGLSPEGILAVLRLSEAEWNQARNEAVRLVSEAMRNRITAEQVGAVRDQLPTQLSVDLNPLQARVAVELARAHIVPNLIVDAAQTEAAREAARRRVEPVVVTVEAGEVILRDGEVATVVALEKLAATGLSSGGIDLYHLGSVGLIAASLAAALAGYLAIFEPRTILSVRRFGLIAVLIVGAVLAARLTIPGRPYYELAFPAAAVSMLAGALLGPGVGLAGLVTLVGLLMVVGSGTPQLAVYGLATGLAGLLAARSSARTHHFFLAGLGVALAGLAATLGFRLMVRDLEPMSLAILGFLCLVNGLLSAALTVGSLAVLGYIFGITTGSHLLELADPNQPLLRRLLAEAPGTYYHSLIVGNLAERAAEAVKADKLLVRVGAYYHDIGKLLRPGFYTENQAPGENIHDRLDPRLSVELIRAHVTDGLELARRHRLPGRVRDLIAEHHGTTLIQYFYHRAKELGLNVSPEEFRYPGPKPRSKEAAILMLADTVEATARSARSHTPEELDAIVDRMVALRIAEGQLDECDLTLGDIERIKGALKEGLRGIYHPRIEYPALEAPKQQLPEPNDTERP
ncbi:MAG: metal-dependent phosphohydrolase [Chloroflexota bacterium]